MELPRTFLFQSNFDNSNYSTYLGCNFKGPREKSAKNKKETVDQILMIWTIKCI